MKVDRPERLTEEWRPAVGWESRYAVSTHGRVRSLTRPGCGDALKAQTNNQGYMQVPLFANGRRRQWGRIHRLVAEAFLERQDGQHLVRHLDGDKTNNMVDNLAWGTVSDNIYDQVRHGTHSRASRTHCRRGHEYTPENIYIKSGFRACRICTKAQWRRGQQDSRDRRDRAAALRVTTDHPDVTQDDKENPNAR